MAEETLFTDVIVPLAVPGRFTYRVPRDMVHKVAVGVRVLVQFGKRKVYTGVISAVHTDPPTDHQAKYLMDVLDARPSVSTLQLRYWAWMSDYYMCTAGEVLQAALPTGLKLSSEQVVCIHPDFDGDLTDMDLTEAAVVEAVQAEGRMTLEQIAAMVHQQSVQRLVSALIVKRALMYAEEVEERYRPRTETYLTLSSQLAADEDALRALFDRMEKKAPKQLDALMRLLHLSRLGSEGTQPVAQKELLRELPNGAAALRQLVEKGIVVKEDREVSRLTARDAWATEGIVLNELQSEALRQVEDALAEKDVCLLHGVTSSGKTEIYIRLIENLLEKNGQTLYMLPEIALTAQVVLRLQKHFGREVGIYHSRMTDPERVEVWQRMNSNEPFKVLLGARSALFLPFADLRLIIVDEEHDTSYKQHDPAPRYNARDSAIVLARMAGAKVVLGSATPAVETMHNARQGKYGLVVLNQRFGGAQLPHILTIDLRPERKAKRIRGPLSVPLIDSIGQALAQREQVILFQNRRGFSSFIQCEQCAHVPQCTRCDISLTYHKYSHDLRCHYCGYTAAMPRECPSCRSTKLLTLGIGTEQVEEELNIQFPNARVVRMDLDTTRAKHAHHRIIQEFEQQQIDILVGTQMVTKGLDFSHVGLVGVVSADQLLRQPDFRAFERAFQLMAQVSGRAGRRGRQGLVLIQTSEPMHPVIELVKQNDHAGLMLHELVQRKTFNYPPFVRLVQITLRHRERDALDVAARIVADQLRQLPGMQVLGPEVPPVGRIRNFYLRNILLKIGIADLAARKQLVADALRQLRTRTELKQCLIGIDVDPM